MSWLVLVVAGTTFATPFNTPNDCLAAGIYTQKILMIETGRRVEPRCSPSAPRNARDLYEWLREGDA